MKFNTPGSNNQKLAYSRREIGRSRTDHQSDAGSSSLEFEQEDRVSSLSLSFIMKKKEGAKTATKQICAQSTLIDFY